MLTNNIIEYAIIEVRGADAEIVSERMGKIAEIALAQDALVDVMISGVVIISRGTLPHHVSQTKFGPFILTLKAIQTALGDDARIVFKREFAHFGDLGSSKRRSYSFIAPNFLTAVRKLADTAFGKILELD